MAVVAVAAALAAVALTACRDGGDGSAGGAFDGPGAEPNAGSWKPYVLTSASEIRVPEPPTASKAEEEQAEVKNQAEQLVFSTETFLKESGDKVPADVKTPVEEALADLKGAIADGSEASTEDIKAKIEQLNTKSQAMGQAVYAAESASAAASGSAGAGSDGSSATSQAERATATKAPLPTMRFIALPSTPPLLRWVMATIATPVAAASSCRGASACRTSAVLWLSAAPQ